MKKVFLLTAVAGMVAFTSCEKEAKDLQAGLEDGVSGTADAIGDGVNATGDAIGDGVNATGDVVRDGANGISDVTSQAYEDAKGFFTDAPSFSNNELQEWANKLHDSAVKAKASSTAGNQEELNEAVAEMATLNESLNKFSGDSEYGKAQAYYLKVQEKLESL